MNSDDNVMAQVLLAETMQGISTVSSSKAPDDYVVKYDGYYAINKELSAFLQEEKNQVCITSSFTNYINAVQSIVFAAKIQLTDPTGHVKDGILLRVEPLEILSENWSFGGAYGTAQLSMITRDGDYIFRANMLKNDNFYEFLRSYNNLTYPQLDEINQRINSAEESGVLEYKNVYGRDTLFTYSTKGYNDWIIIAALYGRLHVEN